MHDCQSVGGMTLTTLTMIEAKTDNEWIYALTAYLIPVPSVEGYCRLGGLLSIIATSHCQIKVVSNRLDRYEPHHYAVALTSMNQGSKRLPMQSPQRLESLDGGMGLVVGL